MRRGLLALAVGLATIAGCTPPPPPTADQRTQRATAEACRRRADEIYSRQNRGAIYIEPDQRSSPFSGDYVSGVTSRGLPARYGYDRMITDCVRESGQTLDRGAGPAMEPTPR
jgi:hypothetical protein